MWKNRQTAVKTSGRIKTKVVGNDIEAVAHCKVWGPTTAVGGIPPSPGNLSTGENPTHVTAVGLGNELIVSYPLR